MDREDLGRATLMAPGYWVRGPARIERGWITLDRSHAERYWGKGSRELTFDLAAVRTPRDMLAFAQRYGMLWAHAEDEDPIRERFADWEREARALGDILRLYELLQRALQDDAEAIADLRTAWADAAPRVGPDFPVLPAARDELLAVVRRGIAALVSHGLKGVGQMLIVDADPGVFVHTALTRDVIGYAYHGLALLLSYRIPVATCVECGRAFTVEDRRQQYCSDRCANRARHRRWRERKQVAQGTA